MYKLLLCWRYLRTRYIALASIISVMLGVATMIVVNTVMEGFTHEMQDRIHGILSDLVFESRSLDGFPDADRHMAGDPQSRRRVHRRHVAHRPRPGDARLHRSAINTSPGRSAMIGVDEATYATVSDFGHYLQHPDNRKQLNFELKEGGYDTVDHRSDDRRQAHRRRPQTADTRVGMRRHKAQYATKRGRSGGSLTAIRSPSAAGIKRSPRTAIRSAPSRQEGDRLRSCPRAAPRLRPRHRRCATITTPTAPTASSRCPATMSKSPIHRPASRPSLCSAKFTVVDFYESKMNEYDSSFVFVPIRKLQELRGMIDPATGIGNFNSIQIRLKPGADLDTVRDMLRANFPPQVYVISTWRDKEGALLAAVQMETAVLNVLLFLIIAVAGFGILAIFFMIVVEKTRDIGILKSLGATGRGIMGIFLGYGLSLGIVGAGVGMVIGLLFVQIHQRDRRPARPHHRPPGVRSVDLLLPQDSDDRRAADRRLDRARRDGDRRAGQHSARAARRPAPSRGGFAL